MNNEPVAWMSPDGKVSDTEGKLFYIPLYTQDQLEEARKLGMRQERALWNLAESTQEIIDTHPVKEQKCMVQGCENHKHEGSFNGDVCSPCYQFIVHGKGIHSQAYRNTHPAELTDEEIADIAGKTDIFDPKWIYLFARAILRKAQEK